MENITRIEQLSADKQRRYNLKILKKIKYSSQKYTEQEITEIVNPMGQWAMYKITDFIKENPQYCVKEVYDGLVKLGMLRETARAYKADNCYTFNYIIPVMKNEKLFSYKEELVTSRKVLDVLQQYLEKQHNQNKL